VKTMRASDEVYQVIARHASDRNLTLSEALTECVMGRNGDLNGDRMTKQFVSVRDTLLSASIVQGGEGKTEFACPGCQQHCLTYVETPPQRGEVAWGACARCYGCGYAFTLGEL